MIRCKHLVFWTLSFFLLTQWNQTEALAILLEPIVGYEQVQQVLPTRHSVNRLMYGARLSLGILILSIESEYTHSTVTETFTNMSQVDTGDRLKVGLRSGFPLGPVLSCH